MIITDKFTCINMPKTGSSYVRKHLGEIYKGAVCETASSFKLRLRKKIGLAYLLDLKHLNYVIPFEHRYDQHGGVFQIPPWQRKKPIVSFYRDPLDYYLSSYFFKGYCRRESIFYDPESKPDRENLSFTEFLDYHRMDLSRSLPFADHGNRLGGFTIHFIWMYANDPIAAFKMALRGETDPQSVKELFPEINFYYFKDLSSEFKRLCDDFSISIPPQVGAALDKRVSPDVGSCRSEEETIDKHVNESLKQKIHQEDAFGFNILRSCGLESE